MSSSFLSSRRHRSIATEKVVDGIKRVREFKVGSHDSVRHSHRYRYRHGNQKKKKKKQSS